MNSCPPSIRSVADLRDLQRSMAGALMSSLTKSDGLRAKFRRVADSLVRPGARLGSFDRLEIYARQYWFRLLDCLHDDYPGLRALLGGRCFHRLCRDYLAAHPSESWTLRNLGCRLESFIRDQPSLTGAKHRMAIDIARFEWAQVLAFDEAALKPLAVDDLLGRDPAEVILKLQPHLSLLDLDYAVDEYFMAARDAAHDSRGEASNARMESLATAKTRRGALPKPQKLWLVVHRSGRDIYFKRIEREAWLLLTSLRDGQPLLIAIESALANAVPDRDWSAQVREWFESWAAMGWFVG